MKTLVQFQLLRTPRSGFEMLHSNSIVKDFPVTDNLGAAVHNLLSYLMFYNLACKYSVNQIFGFNKGFGGNTVC